MRPLDPLETLDGLLRRAPVDAVAKELARLDGEPLEPLSAASRSFGHGALALRSGDASAALSRFDEAHGAFAAAGDSEAAHLSECESWLARIRQGALPEGDGGAGVGYRLAVEALSRVAREASSRTARAVAHHYVAVAERAAGRAEEAHSALLEALGDSDGLLPERAQILNSLGTLYVLTGAFGAACELLEHAADLARRLGDAMGEAIACGQLGTAALAQGELERARRFFQRQHWLASQLGDAFGTARSRTFLAELALDLGRPDEAREHAAAAIEVAESVSPPLGMWVGYASRLRARAGLELGDGVAAADFDGAARQFERIGNRLGAALLAWDRSRFGMADDWARAAWELGSLGLERRVVELLLERRRGAIEPGLLASVDDALAACRGAYGHLAAAHERELAEGRPATLMAQAARRLGGQRNLARLAALTLAPAGLVVAELSHPRFGSGEPPMPPRAGEAVALGGAPGLLCWGWRAGVDCAQVSRDLEPLRRAHPELRGAVVWCPDARVVGLPLPGEAGVRLEGVRVTELSSRARAADEGTLDVDRALGWSEADALALAGLPPS